MNKKFITLLTQLNHHTNKINKFNQYHLVYPFSTNNNKDQNIITHNFPYGQAGQFTFNLKNRTYNIQFQTIWQDYSQIAYSGLTGQNSFFILEQGNGKVKIDDLDLQSNEREYIKMFSKIPEDYTIKGYVYGSVRHMKNKVSSKTRSNSFQLEIGGYKNIYQWLNLQCESVKITNKSGDVNIDNLTVKDCHITCENFISKKVMFSGQVNLKATHKLEVRSVVAYQDALTIIQDSQHVMIESISGKVNLNNIKNLTIDRLLSSKQGINIKCDNIPKQIIIQTGSGVIECLKQSKQVLEGKIKLGKMHKGHLDFTVLNSDPNSPYTKVKVLE